MLALECGWKFCLALFTINGECAYDLYLYTFIFSYIIAIIGKGPFGLNWDASDMINRKCELVQ